MNIQELDRNYQENPLKRGNKWHSDIPSKHDLEYLYITCNMSTEEICQFLPTKLSTLERWLRNYNIKKPRNLHTQVVNRKNKEKYGVENVFQVKDIQSKIINYNIQKYGCCNSAQKHISKETLQILQSPIKLTQFIENQNIKTWDEISKKLHIHKTTLTSYIKKYNMIEYIDKYTSPYEIEINELYGNIFKKTRDIIHPYEIDLYNEERKIGIEFNGNYWHSEYKTHWKYHQEKSLLALSKGVFLYHIWQYEWNDERKKPIIISMINNLLGKNVKKIYARKCEIRTVNIKEAQIFLNNNHIQGRDFSKIKIGLYYNNELVSLMTFGKPRFNKQCEWELIRFCNKINLSVIGGASKLFKYFIKTYNPKSIVSYSNIAKTKGNMYAMLGFQLKEIVDPSYVWCKGDKILTRYKTQKHHLLKLGYKGNTEIEIMRNRNYYRLYDCGSKTWIWSKI